MTRNAQRFVLSVLFGFSVPTASHAQAWPQGGPVTIISSNSPGSAPDIVARMTAEGLSAAFKQQFLVDNRPGGRSIVATVAAARAKPDGYTLYLSGNSAMAANPYTVKALPYDPDRDFTPIAMVIDSAPILLAVNPARVPARTLEELVELARKQPGKLTYAASGSLAPVIGDMLNKTAGIQLRQVRYKETTLALQDTVAGTTDMTILGLPSLEGFVKDGRLRLLASVSRERYPLLPDLPALEETYPGVAIEGWYILFGPAGLPDDISRRIRQALDVYLKRPETLKRLHALGLSTRGAGTPEAAREFVRSERARWERIVRELGIKPQ